MWEIVQASKTDRWFFLMVLHPDADVEFWSHTLKDMVFKQAKKEEITDNNGKDRVYEIVLKSMGIYDGSKVI